MTEGREFLSLFFKKKKLSSIREYRVLGIQDEERVASPLVNFRSLNKKQLNKIIWKSQINPKKAGRFNDDIIHKYDESFK